MGNYSERLRLIKLGLLPKEAVAKERKPIAKKSAKRIEQDKLDRVNGSGDELDLWFKMKMRLPKVCDNCGARLDRLNDKEWRGSQHHILDKALFPSVKTHDLNHIVLGFYCCHSQWHTSIENAKKMSIWGYAKRKVQMFIEEVLESHKMLDYFK